MRREQTKIQSLVEQIVGRLFGFTVAITTAQLFVYGMFGITVSPLQNIGMMAYFTCQNVVVSYFVRRYFEARIKKS